MCVSPNVPRNLNPIPPRSGGENGGTALYPRSIMESSPASYLSYRHVYSLARFAALLALAVPLSAQSAKRPVRSDDIYRIRDVHDPVRSPDGKWVAYAVSAVDTARDRNSSDLWMVSWDGTQQIQLTNTPESEGSPEWSPDGKWLSFLSSRQGGDGSQLWLFNRLGGEPTRVSDVPGGIDDYAWSPDSKRLVFVVSDPDTETTKSKTKKPIVIDRYHFKSDPGGYLLASHEH